MFNHSMRTNRRGRVHRTRRGVVAMAAMAMVAGLLTVVPGGVSPVSGAVPVAATPTSTYCDTLDDASGSASAIDNNGGDSVNVTVNVTDSDTGATLTDWSYLVSLDNTARADDPDPALHPAVHSMASNSPTVATGDEAHSTFIVPDGCRYMISVRAPGYSLWGQHVVLPGPDTAAGASVTVDIDLLADPLPLSTLVVQVFEDDSATNGQPDATVLEGGLAGFQITVDAGGENIVTAGGSPLCDDIGNDCITDADGTVTITGLPYGPYEVTATPPDGSDWIQSTTIEGTVVLDVWLEPGSDGLGPERALRADPNQATGHWFGFVDPTKVNNENPACSGTCGTVTGRTLHNLVAPPFESSIPQPNEPVANAVIAVNNIGGNDEVVRIERADAQGNFTIPNLDPGTYQLAIWDEDLFYVMEFATVVVPETGGTVAMGDIGVFRWFGWLSGYVYLDSGVAADGTPITLANSVPQNGETTDADFAHNGIRDCYDPAATGPNTAQPDPHAHDTCELGLPGEEVSVKFRDGSVFQGGTTDSNGWYELSHIRGPLGRYVVPEVGFARRDRTGHSIHNEYHFGGTYDPYVALPIPGDKGGDLLLAAILWEGHRTWVDWGKANYDLSDPQQNGGIAGAVLYGVTINENNPAVAGQEPYEPGIPGVPLRLWGRGVDGTADTDDDVLLAEIETDAWSHPVDGDGPQPQTAWSGGNDTPCNLLDNFGSPVADPNGIAAGCLEIPANGNETQDGAWDGGFAFEDNCSAGINGGTPVLRGDPTNANSNYNAPAGTWSDTGTCDHLTDGVYAVQVLVPEFYQIVKEESVNTDEGVDLVPQLPPPPCVGELHTVPATAHPAYNTDQPLCDLKVVQLQRGQNAAVEFTLYTECSAPGGPSGGGCDDDRAGTAYDDIVQRWSTDYSGNADEPVPLPARYYGFSEDGVSVDNDPNSLTYGEKFGVPGIPIGIYDHTGRHLITVNTDENGYYEFIAPSSFTVSAPTPNGLVPGMYRFVPNDPTMPDPANPGQTITNPSFDPGYLTQPWVFQALPGKMRHADTPLFPINGLVCYPEQGKPQLLEVDSVYVVENAGGGHGAVAIEITGTALEDGANPPTVRATGPGGTIDLTVTNFVPSDANAGTFEDVVTVEFPANQAVGAYQIELEADGFTSVNGITFHVLADGTTVHTVGPTSNLDLGLTQPIQAAIDAAGAGDFIDVTPGVYRENLVVDVDDLTLQGHGPGGVIGNVIPEPGDDAAQPPTDTPFSGVSGTVIDSRYFFGDGAAQALWTSRAPVGAPRGASMSLFDVPSTFIDGFSIGFGRGEIGGGVWAEGGSPDLTVSNNVIAHTVGGFGGAVVLGIPSGDVYGGPSTGNTGASIVNNRIIQNGGISQAGGIGLHGGSDGYEVAFNDICGNFAQEYGGGVSHFGTSPGGHIHDNRIFYNDAFDEGGGVMIAGDLNQLTPTESGAVVVEANEISYNLANDDGGGVRLLAPGTSAIEIINNFINHNVATDHGGGISIDDASNVTIVHNTVVENASTSTSADAEAGIGCGLNVDDTCPRGAGLTGAEYSANFPGTPPAGGFTDPVLINNIFWNNESFHWDADGGPGNTGALVSVGNWDLEVVDSVAARCFSPQASFLSVASHAEDASGCDYSTGNTVGVDPLVKTDLTLNGLEIDAGPNLLNGDVIVVEIVRGEDGPQGAGGAFFVDLVDMHLESNSPAIDQGIDPTTGSPAGPAVGVDIDDDTRPSGTAADVGADEVVDGGGPGTPTQSLYISVDCGQAGTSCPDDGSGDTQYDIDIYRFDEDLASATPTPNYVQVFDGSDVMTQTGTGNPRRPETAQIDAFAFLSPNEILISFQRPMHRTVFGITGSPNSIDDSDILLFTATSLGANTSGTWSRYFDGSDVGLGAGAEDIDALDVDPANGDLLISTVGNGNVGTMTWPDEDIVRFSFIGAPGDPTDGVWSPFFDGSAADGANGSGLNVNGEDIDGFGLDTGGPNLHFSTIGNVRTFETPAGPPYRAQDDDVTTCVVEVGASITCDEWETLLDGATAVPTVDLSAFDIKGLDLVTVVLP